VGTVAEGWLSYRGFLLVRVIDILAAVFAARVKAHALLDCIFLGVSKTLRDGLETSNSKSRTFVHLPTRLQRLDALISLDLQP
jgi:hypothetical protein